MKLALFFFYRLEGEGEINQGKCQFFGCIYGDLDAANRSYGDIETS
jgi:hypothetical protein